MNPSPLPALPVLLHGSKIIPQQLLLQPDKRWEPEIGRLSKQAADEQRWLRAKRRTGEIGRGRRGQKMLGLITERLCKVNCSPDWDLGHIHPQTASCHQVSLDKQQEPVDLEQSKASRAKLCLDRVQCQQRALLKHSPALRQAQPS